MYEDEKKNLEGIAKYLDKMEIPYIFEDLGETNEEKFPALACVYRNGNLDFDVIIYSVQDWVHVKALVIETQDFPIDIAFKIYEACLDLNYQLPECTFSAYKRKIYIEMDCLASVDFDDFQGEFNSIAQGINAFIEIMEKHPEVKLISTKGKKFSAKQREK